MDARCTKMNVLCMSLVILIVAVSKCKAQDVKCTSVSGTSYTQRAAESCSGLESCREFVFSQPSRSSQQDTSRTPHSKAAKPQDKAKHRSKDSIPTKSPHVSAPQKCAGGVYCHEDEWSILGSCRFVGAITRDIRCWCAPDTKIGSYCSCESDTPLIDATEVDVICPSSPANATEECWVVIRGSQLNRTVFMSIAISQCSLLAIILLPFLLSKDIRDEVLLSMVIISRSISIFLKDDVTKVSQE